LQNPEEPFENNKPTIKEGNIIFKPLKAENQYIML